MNIGKDKQEIQLVNKTTKSIRNNMVKVYDTKTIEEEKREVKMAEVRTIDPYVSQAVKCTLTGKDLTGYAMVEQLDRDKEVYVETQLVTIRKYKPKAKAKCLQKCSDSHASNCPTQEYYYAYVMVFNARNKPVLITQEMVVGKYELMDEAEKDLEVIETREKKEDKTKEKVTMRVDLKPKKKVREIEKIAKDIKSTTEKKVKVTKPSSV